MIPILNVIAPIFIIIFASAIFQKIKPVKNSYMRVLNQFALNIGLPLLIFSSLSRTKISLADEFNLIIINSLYILFIFFTTIIISKILALDKKTARTILICTMFSNVAYLGIPLLTEIYGQEILPQVSLIVAIHLFWIFSLGIGHLEYSITKDKSTIIKKTLLNLFKNPLLLSVVLGFIFIGLQISLPKILLNSIDMITSSVTPMVLVVIGLFIGKFKVGNWEKWMSAMLFVFISIITIPLGLYSASTLFQFDFNTLNISILQFAMPIAITPFALADKYNLDKDFISRSIILSTVLSIATLPLWIFILK